MIAYLSAEDIRDFHEAAIERYGGVMGEHEPGLIELMAEKPMQVVFGQEAYPGLFMKAAVYWEGFAARQFFADGNKRTAYATTAMFLCRNGHRFVVSDMELYDISMAVANGHMTLEELAAWIESHVETIGGPEQFLNEP